MAQFLIEIAGYTGRIDSLFESTRDYCRNYLTEKAPHFSVTVSREDLAFEQEALRQEALEEGIKIRKFPLNGCPLQKGIRKDTNLDSFLQGLLP